MENKKEFINLINEIKLYIMAQFKDRTKNFVPCNHSHNNLIEEFYLKPYKIGIEIYFGYYLEENTNNSNLIYFETDIKDEKFELHDKKSFELNIKNQDFKEIKHKIYKHFDNIFKATIYSD